METTLLVSLAGALLAIAIPTFLRSVETSKMSEATTQLEELYRAAAAYYATDHDSDDATLRGCFAAHAGPTPAEPSVDPVQVDFTPDASPHGKVWSALGFEPTVPLRYRYSYVPASPGCGSTRELPSPALRLRAEGDLDGDGDYSTFERRADVVDGELTPDPILFVRDRIE